MAQTSRTAMLELLDTLHRSALTDEALADKLSGIASELGGTPREVGFGQAVIAVVHHHRIKAMQTRALIALHGEQYQALFVRDDQ